MAAAALPSQHVGFPSGLDSFSPRYVLSVGRRCAQRSWPHRNMCCLLFFPPFSAAFFFFLYFFLFVCCVFFFSLRPTAQCGARPVRNCTASRGPSNRCPFSSFFAVLFLLAGWMNGQGSAQTRTNGGGTGRLMGHQRFFYLSLYCKLLLLH